MSFALPTDQPFLDAVIGGVSSAAWVNNRVTQAALETEVRAFEDVRDQFAGWVAPVDWITVARIVWMFKYSERTEAEWRLTRAALDKVGLNHLVIHKDARFSNDHVIGSIKTVYDTAMNEIWCAPATTTTTTTTQPAPTDGGETEEEEEEEEPEHVIAADGMRKIKQTSLSLALRAQTARRGANDSELKRQDLAFECPYFCKPGGHAAIIEVSTSMTRHMRDHHDRPAGFRVTVVDTEGKQYKMAGSAGAEVVWKLVSRA